MMTEEEEEGRAGGWWEETVGARVGRDGWKELMGWRASL